MERRKEKREGKNFDEDEDENENEKNEKKRKRKKTKNFFPKKNFLRVVREIKNSCLVRRLQFYC